MQGSPPWSDLPPELLGLVFLRLPTRADRAFFPVVRRTWCSAARQCRLPSPSPVPWLVLPGGNVISIPHGETFQLPEGLRYHNSCGEWLLLSRDDGSWQLLLDEPIHQGHHAASQLVFIQLLRTTKSLWKSPKIVWSQTMRCKARGCTTRTQVTYPYSH